MQKKPGYILFLLFSILSLCSVLISIYFSKVIIYRQLISQSELQNRCHNLALSSMAFAQDILIPRVEKQKNDSKDKAAPSEDTSSKILISAFPFFNKIKEFEFKNQIDGFEATISMSIQSEQGKLNLNSLYDITQKKFINEGKNDDRKKLCDWIFKTISKITGKPSLMPAFEEYLKNKSHEFNDVTELLLIKDFAEQFNENVFLNFDENYQKNIFLTDIFTVCSDQETINPWLFSHSWCLLLDLKLSKKLNDDDIKKFFSTIKTDSNWQTDWNKNLQPLYQKEYDNLPQEIKSILTTRYEANIFSLLLKAKVKNYTSTIFAIVKTNTKQHLARFDIIKTYQI